jgi:hypothetical protein
MEIVQQLFMPFSTRLYTFSLYRKGAFTAAVQPSIMGGIELEGAAMAELAQSLGQGAGLSHRPSHNRLSTIQVHTRPKIGQILLETGAITSPNLHHAMKLALESKQPIGRMFVSLGYISETQLEAALLAQSLIGQGVVSESVALTAVKTATHRKVSFNEALSELDNLDPSRSDDGSLGGLLVASGMIPPETFQHAMKKSSGSGVLIGQVLLVTQTITVTMLDDVLTVAALIRDGELTRDQAVAVLKEVRRSRISVTSAIRLSRIKPLAKAEYVRLGELLRQSRVISEREALMAIESALQSGRKLGEEMVAKGMVPVEVVNKALALQHLVNRSVLPLKDCEEVLRKCVSRNKSIGDVASELHIFEETLKEARALNLCLSAKILHVEAINSAVQQYEHLRLSPVKAALAADVLSVHTFSAALALMEQIESGTVSNDQAAKALRHCNQSACDVQVSLAAVGLAPDQEEQRKESRKSLMERAGATVSDWASYDELLPLLCLGPTAAGGAYLLVRFLHVNAGLAAYLCLIVVAAGLLKYGCAWRKRSLARQDAQSIRMECARDTKARLSQRTR